MILEVLDARTGEVRTRVRIRLDALPLALGRGFGNDLILDDPYVDARHARITTDDAGALVVEDLGSVNGVLVHDAPERLTRLQIQPGMTVRVGRTTLRFRDPDEPVPSALLDVPESAPPVSRTRRWLSSKWGRVVTPVAAVTCVAANTWLHSYEPSSGSDTYIGVLAFMLIGVFWAGVWSAASRIAVQRFHYMEHLAVTSVAVLVALIFTLASDWMAFLFPDNAVYSPLTGAVSLVFVAALVSGHLMFASSLSRRGRWRAGIVTSAILLALGGAATLVESDSFSDVPEFTGVLKPFRAQWLPAATVESFGGSASELKEAVDALAAEE